MYVTNPTVSPKEEKGLSGGEIIGKIIGFVMFVFFMTAIGGPVGLGLVFVLLVVGSFMESSNSRLIHLLFTEIFFTMEYRNFCSKASVQKFLCPIVQKNFCEK